MLPLFGKVLSFLMDTTEVVNSRPAPPPSTNSAQFKKELEEVLWFSQNPDRDRMKVVHFWGDGAGTYAPPGHWNDIACEDFVKQRWSEVRWARNLALLNSSMFTAAVCCWDAKYYYFNPRPVQVNPECKTLTGLPNFPAFTSGHSTFRVVCGVEFITAATLKWVWPWASPLAEKPSSVPKPTVRSKQTNFSFCRVFSRGDVFCDFC
ncbi:MAG: hypothetical protein EBT60_04495 [Bacteroidetes bacterium]|nr:hypothetical protein [Bacteroidota bacterium]